MRKTLIALGAVLALGGAGVWFLQKEAPPASTAEAPFDLTSFKDWAVVLVAGGFLWLQLTRWLLPERDGHFFSVAWSVLGPVFLAAGLWLRERT